MNLSPFARALFPLVFIDYALFLASCAKVSDIPKPDANDPEWSGFSDEPDMSNWVDPQQMYAVKPKKPVAQAGNEGASSLAEKCQPLLRATTAQQQITFLRHIFRPFVSTIHAAQPNAQVVDVMMRIRRDEMLAFERLFEAETMSDTTRVLDAWKAMIRTVIVAKEPTSVETIEKFIGVELRLILLALLISVIPVFIIYVEVKLRLSLVMFLMRMLKYGLIVGFLISVPWTWLRLYQEKVAEQQARLMQNDQMHCKKLNVWQTLGRFVASKLSMAQESTPCEKYYRAISVHPYLDVPFTSAIAITFTQFIMEPLKLIGKGIGEFFQGLLAPLPFYMWPVMILCSLLIIFLVILVRSNYKIHLPYFFARIEPGNPPPSAPAIVDRATDEFSRMALEEDIDRPRRTKSALASHSGHRKIVYRTAMRPAALGYGAATKRSKSDQTVRRRDNSGDWETIS